MASDKRDAERARLQELWLDALRTGSTVTSACALVGVSRQTAYRWRDEFPEFAEAWDSEKALVVERIEQALTNRAIDSSDQAAMFLLKAHDPKYRDRATVTHEGNPDAPVVTVDLSALSKVELREYLALTRKVEGA